jgi:hypothetical protein
MIVDHSHGQDNLLNIALQRELAIVTAGQAAGGSDGRIILRGRSRVAIGREDGIVVNGQRRLWLWLGVIRRLLRSRGLRRTLGPEDKWDQTAEY